MSAISFSDIALSCNFSDIGSRSVDVDLKSDMGKFSMDLPVFSANMPQITEWKMAREMAIHGGMGIIHRFMTVEENVRQYKKAKRLMLFPLIKKELEEIIQEVLEDYKSYTGDAKLLSLGRRILNLIENVSGLHPKYKVGVSIGVKESERERERCKALYDAGARIFCIDIAHGHSQMMKDMITWIRANYGEEVCIIAGNIATCVAATDLLEWGADILKVGIGPGRVCRTRSNTGVGIPQFTALERIRSSHPNAIIISDGGIKTTGCIAKALIHANAVMVGAVLAGTTETPGDAFPEPGTDLTTRTFYKVYGGSASMENKVANGQSGRFNEGEMLKIPFKGHARYMLREINDGLQSSFSYQGAHNLQEFKEKVHYEIMSGGGQRESKVGE